MAAVCIVSRRDYDTHFKGMGEVVQPAWEGVERRTGKADRRAYLHDRRFVTEMGRRKRLADRRRTR